LAALREALQLARGRGEPVVISIVPWLAAVLLAEHLPAEQVVRVGSGVAALASRVVATGGRTMIDIFGAPHDRARLAQAVEAARETLGEAAFASTAAAGRALTFDELLDELLEALEDGKDALATRVQVASPSRQIDSLLSPRERDVLTLVAAGRSNKEIAETLFIAPSTVKTHVTSLLTKLDAENRAQLATIAVQRKLLSDQPGKATN
jgi:DNA-binding CsgD family transcriptional regulator